jgi:transcriptional regulator with XRE-family HTH domain
MTIGEKIKDLRKERGLTQQELADLSKLTCAAIINIEKGYNVPSASSLYKISEALEYNYDKLAELI